MRYKVGDKVKVRKDLEVGKRYGYHFFVDAMEMVKGNILTIERIENGSYCMKEISYYWTDEMLEDINEDEMLLEFALKKLDKSKDELKIEYKIENSNDKFKLAYNEILKLHNKYNNKLSKECRDIADMFKRDKLENKIGAIQEVLDIMFKILNEEGE